MKKYVLQTPLGPVLSPSKGTLGGHRKLKIYGQLNCPSALRYIAKGQYVSNRVFFRDGVMAVKCGYRPCARCMPEQYSQWKKAKSVKA